MNLPKIRCCFAVTAIAACFAALSASAAMLSQEGFETSRDSFVAPTPAEDDSSLKTYAGDAPGESAAYPFDSYGSQYFAVDSGDMTLWHTFSTRTSSTYFDSFVKLTPMQGEFEYPADSKFLIYLNSETNLCVISGTAVDNRTAVTNTLVTNPAITPNTWGRLTIKALSGSVFSFQVLLNGTLLKTANNVDTFYSLTADTALSEVGVSGTGALDNFAVRTTDPFIANEDKAATVGSESYATLEQALEEANGATITLDADHAGTIAASAAVGTSYAIAKNGHTFGGFTGASGITIVESTLNGITTYSVNKTASVGDTVVWRNSGTAGTDISNANAANNTSSHRFCLPAMDGLPAGSTVRISNISLGSRNTELGDKDPIYVSVVKTATDYSDSQVLNGTGRFSGETISACGTYAPRLSYSFDGGVTVVVGETYALETLQANKATMTPGFKCVQTSDPQSAVVLSSVSGSGWYPVYEITATVLSIGGASDISATISGNANLSALSWSAAMTTDGTQWADVEVTQDATLALDTATNFRLLTIHVAEGKTLTLTGANALTASKIKISGLGTVAAATSSLSGTLVGGGTVSYTGALPSGVTVGYDWCGTLALNNIAITGPNFNSYGNVASAVRLSGISGWVNTGTEYVVPIILDNGGYDFALKLKDANSPRTTNGETNRCTVIRKLTGSGTLIDGIAANGKTGWPVIKVYDAGGFTGSLDLDLAVLLVCDETTVYSPSLYDMFGSRKGTLRIESGKSVTLASGKTWSVKTIESYGNLTDGGTLEGAGFVTFNGGLPAGTYNNAAWTGTVKLSSIPRQWPLNLSNYAGDNSAVEVNGVGANNGSASGEYLAAGKIATKLVLTGSGMTLTDGSSTAVSEIGELAGAGTLAQSKDTIYQGLKINVMTNFTGSLCPGNMIVTFGTTSHAGNGGGASYNTDTMRRLYIDSNAVVSVAAGFELWSPAAIDFNGPVNFTTDAVNYDGLVLFSNVGSNVAFGNNARVTINGVDANSLGYKTVVNGTNIILLKRKTLFLFK